MLQQNKKNPVNLAKRLGLQGGIPGSSTGNRRATATQLVAEMMNVFSIATSGA